MVNNRILKITTIKLLFIMLLLNFSNAEEIESISLDKKYTEKDCIILRDFLLKKVELSEDEMNFFDINRDGKVTITDLSLLKENLNHVDENKLKDIKITALPTKTSFYYGETINFNGLKVDAIYENNETEDITSNCTISEVKNNKFGTQRVFITYEGKSKYFTISIIKRQEYGIRNYLRKIAVSKYPNKIYYKYGETIDLTGLVVEKIYLDRNKEEI